MESLTPNSNSMRLDSHFSPENFKWLAENINGVDETAKVIIKLIEDEYSSYKEVDGCYKQKPELVDHVTRIGHMNKLLARICHMHRSLAERYDQLTEEVRTKFSSVVDMKHSGTHENGTQHASLLQTPDQKLSMPKSEQNGDCKLYLSSGSGSTDSSLKEGFEYTMSSDSESESFYSTINKDLVSPMSVKSKVPQSNYVEQTELQGTEVVTVQKIKKENVNVDDTAKGGESGNYDVLLRRLAKCEEELISTKRVLQFSEKENARMDDELKRNESVEGLMDDLKVQLDAAHQSIKIRDGNLDMEKQTVLELQNQVAELQSQIGDYKCNNELLVQELKMYRKKLEGSEDELVELKHDHHELSEGARQFQSQLELAHKEMALLDAKLNSKEDQVMELQNKISDYVASILQHDQEYAALKAELSDAHINFSGEKELLQSDISGLLEQNFKLNAIFEEFETKIKSLQYEIRSCNSEKMDMQASHVAQVNNLQVDIDKMKAEVKAKDELVEAMNKNLDMLKLKHDMLIAKKDDLDAKIDNLYAELSSKDNKIQELNNHLDRLHLEKVEMVVELERASKHEEELKEKAVELQNEVDRQVAVISDRAEEKREAIRVTDTTTPNNTQDAKMEPAGMPHKHTCTTAI